MNKNYIIMNKNYQFHSNIFQEKVSISDTSKLAAQQVSVYLCKQILNS